MIQAAPGFLCENAKEMLVVNRKLCLHTSSSCVDTNTAFSRKILEMKRPSRTPGPFAQLGLGVEEGSYSLFGSFISMHSFKFIYTYTILSDLVLELYPILHGHSITLKPILTQLQNSVS